MLMKYKKVFYFFKNDCFMYELLFDFTKPNHFVKGQSFFIENIFLILILVKILHVLFDLKLPKLLI